MKVGTTQKLNRTSKHSHILYVIIYKKILEVNLFAFAYRLFHEDFSLIDWALLLFT